MLRVFSFLFFFFLHPFDTPARDKLFMYYYYFFQFMPGQKTVSLTHIRQVFFRVRMSQKLFLFPDWPSSLLQRKKFFESSALFFSLLPCVFSPSCLSCLLCRPDCSRIFVCMSVCVYVVMKKKTDETDQKRIIKKKFSIYLLVAKLPACSFSLLTLFRGQVN